MQQLKVCPLLFQEVRSQEATGASSRRKVRISCSPDYKGKFSIPCRPRYKGDGESCFVVIKVDNLDRLILAMVDANFSIQRALVWSD